MSMFIPQQNNENILHLYKWHAFCHMSQFNAVLCDIPLLVIYVAVMPVHCLL